MLEVEIGVGAAEFYPFSDDCVFEYVGLIWIDNFSFSFIFIMLKLK
jgi:hypothetical protein